MVLCLGLHFSVWVWVSGLWDDRAAFGLNPWLGAWCLKPWRVEGFLAVGASQCACERFSPEAEASHAAGRSCYAKSNRRGKPCPKQKASYQEADRLHNVLEGFLHSSGEIQTTSVQDFAEGEQVSAKCASSVASACWGFVVSIPIVKLRRRL